MGESDYEIVRRFIDALIEKDFETSSALLHDDVVFNEPAGLHWGGEWKGLDGIGGRVQKILSEYSFEVTEAEVSDAGDRVLVEAKVEFTSNQSGTSMTQTIAEIYRVEDGKIVANRIFYHDIPALTGLHESAAAAT